MDPQQPQQQQAQPPVQPPADDPPQAEEPTTNVKQQIVEKINEAKNVLVTVGANATVDELASALGLTFLLGKLSKHATAVFSGKTPPAIDFLDPDKTFERSVDSLRDFIIALDKEKADKLRYKVEDDVVKVFITPYKTTISEKDLKFSQGDYNVDVVVAIGITKREELDKAIVAHGRILHDAEVLTINANGKQSSLGSIDWSDSAASSIAEMLVSVSESFGSGLIDEQISTAFLTGIVAETNRFSNEKTSPKVMTMAAQLMAAGANQQLIATNLRQEGMISESISSKQSDDPHDDAEMVLDHDDDNDKKAAAPPQPASDQIIKPSIKPEEPKQDTKPVIKPQNQPDQKAKPPEPKPQKVDIPAPVKPTPPPSAPPTVESTSIDSAQSTQVPESVKSEPVIQPIAPPISQPKHEMMSSAPKSTQIVQPDLAKEEAQKPSFGGTLNATTAQAEQDRIDQEAREKESNNTTLEHMGGDKAAEDAIEAARAALEEVSNEMPFDPKNNPTQSVGAQQLPPIRESGSPSSQQPDSSSPQPPPLPSTDPITPDAAAGEMQEQAAAEKVAATSEPEPSPVDAFLQPHADAPETPNAPNNPVTTPASPTPGADLPPLPPMPPMPTDPQALPPTPPQAPSTDPTAGFQPQVGPDFMKGMPQSKNSWTEAGEDVAAKQAEKDAARQAKLDQLGSQYDAAADKNRELQGLPPQNDDHSTFPLPPTR